MWQDDTLESTTHSFDKLGRWIYQAECANRGDMDLGDFFVDAGRSIDPTVLEVCENCPVRRDCLSYSFDTQTEAGYFGGVSPGQRKKLGREQALAMIATPVAIS